MIFVKKVDCALETFLLKNIKVSYIGKTNIGGNYFWQKNSAKTLKI
jgi:hypothetical protein